MALFIIVQIMTISRSLLSMEAYLPEEQVLPPSHLPGSNTIRLLAEQTRLE